MYLSAAVFMQAIINLETIYQNCELGKIVFSSLAKCRLKPFVAIFVEAAIFHSDYQMVLCRVGK